MAKFLILKPFKDAGTGEIYKVGAVVDFPRKRADEIDAFAPGLIAPERGEAQETQEDDAE